MTVSARIFTRITLVFLQKMRLYPACIFANLRSYKEFVTLSLEHLMQRNTRIQSDSLDFFIWASRRLSEIYFKESNATCVRRFCAIVNLGTRHRHRQERQEKQDRQGKRSDRKNRKGQDRHAYLTIRGRAHIT